MKWFWRGLPHVTIILSLMTLTFFAIDRINRSMAFMTSEMSKFTFAGLALCALLTSCALIGQYWKADARSARKERKELQRQKELSDELFRQHETARMREEDPAVRMEDTAGRPGDGSKSANDSAQN